MHLDLSSLPPPMIQPSPPSNTLIITQLTNPQIFTPATLSQIQTLLSTHAGAQIHTFSPLKSMKRIIVSFPSVTHAIELRKVLDGEEILGSRARVYFGVETPVIFKDQHLQAPDAGRLFFISPPPSPPLGWTMRNEDPPNKAVHADDLASALAKLREGNGGNAWGPRWTPEDDESGDVAGGDMMDEEADISPAEAAARRARMAAMLGAQGNNATVVYHPEDHGSHASLPAVLVEDVSGNEEDARLQNEKRILTHTARPPVELMMDDEGMDMS